MKFCLNVGRSTPRYESDLSLAFVQGEKTRRAGLTGTAARIACHGPSVSDAQTTTQSNPTVASDSGTAVSGSSQGARDQAVVSSVGADHNSGATAGVGSIASNADAIINGFKLGNISGGITVTNSGDPELSRALSSSLDSLAKQQADVLKSLASGIGNSGSSGYIAPALRATTTPPSSDTPLTPEEAAAKETRNKLILGGALVAAIVLLSR